MAVQLWDQEITQLRAERGFAQIWYAGAQAERCDEQHEQQPEHGVQRRTEREDWDRQRESELIMKLNG